MTAKLEYFSFEQVMTSKFLFYAWIELRNSKNYFSFSFHNKYLRKSWFKNTSNLIANSQFTYKKSVNITSVRFLKNKIIENSILLFLFSFLKKKNLNLNFPLTECVRKLIQ